MATLKVDPSTSFNVAIHASYHNDFFLLRTRVLVNGESTEIKSIEEDEYEGPALNFCHSGSTVSTKLYLVARTASPTLVQYGVYHVDTFYYEQSPLFHVVFSSESCLENFILAMEEVKSALESKLQSLFSHNLKTGSAQKLVVEVQPDLYFVSPNRQETKGAELHLVTTENCSTFVTRWRNSKLFDFGALYQEEAKPPKLTSQPTSQNDVLPGKAVTFSVQATGTEPLGYQWQWKQFGKKGEKIGWQNMSGDSSTFQVRGVKASNAGYYQCVVFNSAGSETSLCASLIIVPEVCDLEGELHDVIDWISLGLRLGIKLPELKIIEKNYPNDLKRRRTEMFEEWQKQVTPTWSAVVQALVGIGMRHLAYELAQKHGIPPPKLPDDDPLDQLENVQEEEATVSKLREDIQKLRSDLIQEHEKLVDAEQSKNKANKEARDAAAKLEESHENVQKIIQEKKKLEMELKVKERECQLLCAMQEKDEEFNQFLKIKVDEKEKEIKSLKEELQMKESGLQFAVQELQTQQEKLSKARKKLKKKHKEVMQLQKEKEELACSYNSEMERVSKLVQITSSLTSDREEMKQKLSIVEAESELKSQQIEVCSADINHLSENIKTLSSSLQKEEARAVQLQSELQAREQVASTQLLTFVKLTTQIAELERKLQEAEEQKQQAELERKATVKEMKAKENLKAQLHAQLDEPPKITDQPKSLNKVPPGKPAMFTLQATGTEPLSYHWQWKPVEEEGGSEGWQTCRAEWSDGATLTIPSVQKSNEGNYRCVISNYAGTQTSNPAKLSIANPPRITTHPQELRDAVPGKAVRFTAVATGTQPLRYQWEWKPPGEAVGESSENEVWQPCNVERFPGADSSTVTIPSVEKSNEGSYHCVISNCAGSQTSNPAELSVADPPRITTHPQELKADIQGKPAKFTIQATGTEPLSYNWQWKPVAEEGEWQPCPTQWCDGATLTIPSVQKSNEGRYCCVVINCAGSQTSNPAKLETCPPLQLPLQLRWRRWRDMEYGMTNYPHCVVLERRVYVGGGNTYYGDDAHIVFKYDPDTDNWSHLPRYQYKKFAISIIDSHLTLVGGCDDRGKPTNQLAVYEPSSQHWTYPYHPMPTPRYNTAVVMYDIWLLVAGGCDGHRELATVELFNTSTNQWLAASSLPTLCRFMTSATIKNLGYFVTARKQVYRVSLPDIVSQTVDQSTASKSPALWRCLPDTPLENSTAISLRGYLIAVGGRHDNRTRTDIHLYQPESEQWTKVGDLPNARKYCSCVVLPSGELLVAGGRDKSSVLTRRVDVASVLN